MNKKINIVSISSSDLIDAKLDQLRGLKQCPSCGHKLEEEPEWLGLPAGVKFDPTDQELIEHLEAQVVEASDVKSHPLIDEFIPTIEGEDGICYTHPEKLPGVTRDGLSRHFFHRPSKAYTTGTRKRRKIIQTEESELQAAGGETRWHKTGKTRPVMVSGKQKGCKKIMVLYTNFGKNRKPEKTNWVMHQYHLGQLEEEKEGELVVSKIFYQTQPRQCNWVERKSTASNVNGGSSCSSKEIMDPLIARDGMSGAGFAAALSSYNPMDIQQLHSDHFAFLPFRKSFDEVRIAAAEAAAASASMAREENPAVISGTYDEIDQEHHDDHHRPRHHHGEHDNYHDHQPQQQHRTHHQIAPATSAFHLSRPSSRPSISTIISSPPLHHTSIILDEDSYHISRLLLQNEIQQQQQHHHLHHQRQQHNIGARAASGLEELIMGCNSADTKEGVHELSMANPQEVEWLKCSSFWPDPENLQDHHV